MHGVITKIQRFSLHDGPGIRTTVFLKGCPLSCIWCQNPETITDYSEVLFFSGHCIGCRKCIEICPKQCFSFENKTKFKADNCNQCGLCIDNCPAGALKWSSGKELLDDILKEVMKDKIYYDFSGGGITLSGGEPLHQTDFCYNLALKSKDLGLHVVVDTSGYVDSEALMRIASLVDLFLYDIKFINNELHERYTGKSNDLILENFRKLCKAKKQILARVPLIPEITDQEDNLLQISNFVKDCGEHIKIDYIPFNTLSAEKYDMVGKESIYKQKEVAK